MGRALTGEPPRPGQLAEALSGAALVELIEFEGTLTALTLSGARLGRHRLGELAPITEQLDWLRFALTRLAASRRTPEEHTQVAGARASAETLDRLVLQPLAEAIGNRAVVLVPTGALHAVPWAMLPSMRGRPLVVSPSAATWLALQTRTRDTRSQGGRCGGPSPASFGREAQRTWARSTHNTTILSRREATVAAVTEALDGARVAHIACHGSFRADSPLFSSLELSDGALNVYELQRLRRPRAHRAIRHATSRTPTRGRVMSCSGLPQR